MSNDQHERSEEGIESTDLLCPFCGSDKMTTEHNIGFDIDPSGEERQYIDRCECGAWRFHNPSDTPIETNSTKYEFFSCFSFTFSVEYSRILL